MVSYRAPWIWPESTQVQSERLREVLADLSAFTRKNGVVLVGAESLYLEAAQDGVAVVVTDPETKDSRTYTWDDEALPEIVWHQDMRCYLTTSELAQWEAIRARSGIIYGDEADEDYGDEADEDDEEE